jgi:hypothetical protein
MALCRWCARASIRATLAGRRTGSGFGGGGVSLSVTRELRLRNSVPVRMWRSLGASSVGAACC